MIDELDNNVPEKLKNKFNNKELRLADLIENPEWVSWLKGHDEYVKKFCISEDEYDVWSSLVRKYRNTPNNVNVYMSLLYEEELRADILGHENVRLEAITKEFKERNKDIVLDDLPSELQEILEDDYSNDFNTIFNLSDEYKEFLKGKRLKVFFPREYDEFLDTFGDSIEDFELYESYRGIIISILKTIREGVNISGQDREKEMKELALNVIQNTKHEYDDRMPVEFKEEYPEYFLDEDVPEVIRKDFYSKVYMTGSFDFLSTLPEYLSKLKGKNIRRMFHRVYDNFFEFCESQDVALELGCKYGDIVREIKNWELDDKEALTKEEKLKKLIYREIEDHNIAFFQYLPQDFKDEFPELFFSKEELNKIKLGYTESHRWADIEGEAYKQNIRINDLLDNTELLDVMRNKNVKALMKKEYAYLLDLCDGDADRFIDVVLEYGGILDNPKLGEGYQKDSSDREKNEIEIIDELIYKAILDDRADYTWESMSERFRNKYPELFLFPEELELVNAREKVRFYQGKLAFSDLKENGNLLEVIKNKNIRACMKSGYATEDFLERYTELLDGDKDKALNLSAKRFSSQLDTLLSGLEGYQNIDKILQFYKEIGFIPHAEVVKRFPENRLKDFALNSKLWGKLVKFSEEVKDWEDMNPNDVIDSMLEAAMIMGVFETKEFVKNGDVRVQGVGKDGFDKLVELLHYSPEFFRSNYDVYGGDETMDEMGRGYIKQKRDYEDELLYEKIEIAAKSNELYDELVQGELTDSDVATLEDALLWEFVLSEEGEVFNRDYDSGYYFCVVDRKMDSKIKVLFDTIGLKRDDVLSVDEFSAIKYCNEDYILRAFKVTEDGYAFNMSQKDGKFVIGDNIDIGESESKRNKKLFDYVKFLMLEYGLNEEALPLAANNDRSEIDLFLSYKKMAKLRSAANNISEKACNRYVQSNIWRVKEGKDTRWMNWHKLHQIFDGMEMEYNEEFRDFIIENFNDIVQDERLSSRINSIQKKIINMSKDPVYAEVKITPEIVLRALNEIEYIDKKVGFEKGEELAKKFAFSQEQFEEAQEIWEEARKRPAAAIPRVVGKKDEYTYEVLRLDDALGIFMGNVTDCCQKIDGVGESAMLHSMKERSGRVFVVRDSREKVIAQSWLWRNGNTICFDNVEISNSANNQKNQQEIYNILEIVAKDLCDKDAEVLEKLVLEGKIDKHKSDLIKAKRVTVGRGNTDVKAIRENTDLSKVDKENKRPIRSSDYYLYDDDSERQVVLYEQEGYIAEKDVPTLNVHFDENIEKGCKDITAVDIKMVEAIECEIDEQNSTDYIDIKTNADLANVYGVKEDELKLVLGTDWFMLYSEDEKNIEVHKMLRSPSSGVLKKSIREQRDAVRMLMNKAKDKKKTLSMEIENDRVYEATKRMIDYIKKDYDMTIEEKEEEVGYRIEISGIEER